MRELKSEMANLALAAESEQENRAGPTPEKRSKNDSALWDILDMESNRTRTAAGKQDVIAAEVAKYLNASNEPRKSDALKWWANTGKLLYPNMWRVARKYLAIPGSSVPSERLFSSAGQIINDRRASLAEDTAADLILLRGNAATFLED